MREDKERKGNGEWRMENCCATVLHSPFSILPIGVGSTKYRQGAEDAKRRSTLCVLGATAVQFYFFLTQPSANQSAV
jgi:hypothetical protein